MTATRRILGVQSVVRDLARFAEREAGRTDDPYLIDLLGCVGVEVNFEEAHDLLESVYTIRAYEDGDLSPDDFGEEPVGDFVTWAERKVDDAQQTLTLTVDAVYARWLDT